MPISPAAIGIIFNSDKTHVLLIKRKDVPIWVLPGGGIDPEETAEAAIIREIQEETGFLVQIERKCAEYTPINRLAAFTSVFICHIQEGQASLSSETADIQFHSLSALPSTFFDIHYDWLKEALHSSILIQKPLTTLTYFKALKYLLRHPLHVIRYTLTRLKNRS